MDSAVIVAVISFAGTLMGTAGGIIASGKITEYRLKQLEKKVETHTAFASRIPIIDEKIKSLNIRISNLETKSIANNELSDRFQ